jgi:DNA-binding transcriptional LysR family regulator
VRFRFMLHNPAIVDDAAARLRSVDGIIIPHGPLSELPYADLWHDDWVAIVADSNDAVGEVLTREQLGELPWAMTYQSRSAFTSAARQVQQLGIEPRIEVVVESFLSMTHFIVGTSRVAIIQAAIAPLALRAGGVRVVGLPFDPTPLTNALWWHPVHGRDPEHAWMRDLFVEAGRIVDAGAHVHAQSGT